MNLTRVTGLPLSKLREKYLVLILDNVNDFLSKYNQSDILVYFDEQKLYFFKDNICFVYFFKNDKKEALGLIKG